MIIKNNPVNSIILFPHLLYTIDDMKAGVNYTIPKIKVKKVFKVTSPFDIEAKNCELYENIANNPHHV